MRGPRLVLLLLLISAPACTHSAHHAEPTPSASVPAVRALESCGKLRLFNNGTAEPVLCPDGRANAAADAYFRRFATRVLALGPRATPAEVNMAICADFAGTKTSIPVEAQAVQLAEAEQQWHFATDPADRMPETAAACPRPTATTPSG